MITLNNTVFTVLNMAAIHSYLGVVIIKTNRHSYVLENSPRAKWKKMNITII